MQPNLDVFQIVEPAIAYARDVLRQKAPGDALAALESAQCFLAVLKPPTWLSVDITKLLREGAIPLDGPERDVTIESAPDILCDWEKLSALVTTLVGNVQLVDGCGSRLAIELFAEQGVTRLHLVLDGPGSFPDPVVFGHGVELFMEDIRLHWTAATRGGRIDKIPNGLDLRLTGVKQTPKKVEGVEPLLEAITAAHAALSPKGGASPEKALACCEAFLALGDGPASVEPTNPRALWEESLRRHEELITRRGLRVESFMDDSLPPLLMRRRRMTMWCSSLIRLACSCAPAGADLEILPLYDPRAREAGIAAAIAPVSSGAAGAWYVASMRRAIEEGLKGHITCEEAASILTITVSLPDTAGQAIDAWIPGWDIFSARSRQVLRLLKSGGPTPPPELLLDGLLEEELERWLLPKLDTPAAVNAAHDAKEVAGAFPNSNLERLRKALGQVKRGKPKKEVAKPAYAAELLWAFCAASRGREALGIMRFDVGDLESLCTGLTAAPLDHAHCLRLIARAQSTSG